VAIADQIPSAKSNTKWPSGVENTVFGLSSFLSDTPLNQLTRSTVVRYMPFLMHLKFQKLGKWEWSLRQLQHLIF
jgi:hypothetical protein